MDVLAEDGSSPFSQLEALRCVLERELGDCLLSDVLHRLAIVSCVCDEDTIVTDVRTLLGRHVSLFPFVLRLLSGEAQYYSQR